jgi:hypothetical protein
MPWFVKGTERMRLPVAAKKAFSTAGAATAVVASPTAHRITPSSCQLTQVLLR